MIFLNDRSVRNERNRWKMNNNFETERNQLFFERLKKNEHNGPFMTDDRTNWKKPNAPISSHVINRGSFKLQPRFSPWVFWACFGTVSDCTKVFRSKNLQDIKYWNQQDYYIEKYIFILHFQYFSLIPLAQLIRF